MSEWYVVNVDKKVGDFNSKSDVLFAKNVKEAVEQLLWRIDDGWSKDNEELMNLLNGIHEEKGYSYLKFDYKGEEVKGFIEHTKNPIDVIKRKNG